MPFKEEMGYTFPHGCRISHGTGCQMKKPFEDVDVTMHNFSLKNATAFAGQLGYMEFNTNVRLPRHIHMDLNKTKLIDERILVLHGVGLVEVAGSLFAVAPGTLVDAIGGVPHTWTACPPGVRLPDDSVSTGTFTMVYEYEDTTAFFPTASIQPISNVSDYVEHKSSLDEIRFPKLTAQEVVDKAEIIFNKDRRGLQLA